MTSSAIAKFPATCIGAFTLRAIENFPITGRTIAGFPHLINGLAAVKWAAASANRELGSLHETRADAIRQACEEILDGRWHDQFVVDVIRAAPAPRRI